MTWSVVIRSEGIGEDPLTAEIGKGTLVASRYEVLSPLGNGVFKAHDRTRDQTVALRILRWGLDGQEDRARHFRSEIERVCRLRHENLGALYEYAETTSVGGTLTTDGSLHCVAMELVEGVTLPQLLRAPEGLSWKEAFELSAALADGVQAAHDAGLVGLDLQPHNIVRDARGSVRLMGVGRDLLRDAEFVGHTGDRRELGSAAYMSPERLRGETVDHRGDVWSLAVLVFEIFVGRRAFQGEKPVDLAFKIVAARRTTTLEGGGVPPWLVPLLVIALDPDPARRFQTAREFAAALRAAPARSTPGIVVAPAGAVRERAVSWKAPTVSLRGRHMLLEGVTRPKGSADAVRGRIVRFLKSRGYTAAKAPAGQLAYRRGSWAGSLSAFNPKRWQARVMVQEVESERLRAVFDMNTTLQTVVQMERDFWVEEMNGLLSVIEGREPPSMLAVERPFVGLGKRVLRDKIIEGLGQAIAGLLLMYFLGDRLRSFFDWLFD